jgi:hypothetical protein
LHLAHLQDVDASRAGKRERVFRRAELGQCVGVATRADDDVERVREVRGGFSERALHHLTDELGLSDADRFDPLQEGVDEADGADG